MLLYYSVCLCVRGSNSLVVTVEHWIANQEAPVQCSAAAVVFLEQGTLFVLFQSTQLH